jgi:DNA-binding transcriptional LysR family regulator
VCRELHFTRASEVLGITQPTLSYQIKLLEDELGVPLFNRIGKKISMTPAGDILKAHCQTIFSSLTGARQEIQEWQRSERGALSIAALIGEINELVSRLLGEFYKSHPKLQFTLRGLEDVTKPLIQEELDFGVTILSEEDERFEQIPLYEEPFYLVTSRNHPLAGRTTVDFDEIADQNVVMFPKSHRCRQMIDAVCSVKGFQLRPQIETTTIDSLLLLIGAGAGVSILSKTLLALYDTHHLQAIPLSNPELRRAVGVIYLKNKYIGGAAREFIELLKKHAQSR